MTIFSVLFYSLLSHSVEQYRINCSLPPLCPTHKKRFTQIQNVLPQDIKIHGCIESKHKTSIFTFFQVGILLQWYLVSKQQQKKQRKNIQIAVTQHQFYYTHTKKAHAVFGNLIFYVWLLSSKLFPCLKSPQRKIIK